MRQDARGRRLVHLPQVHRPRRSCAGTQPQVRALRSSTRAAHRPPQAAPRERAQPDRRVDAARAPRRRRPSRKEPRPAHPPRHRDATASQPGRQVAAPSSHVRSVAHQPPRRPRPERDALPALPAQSARPLLAHALHLRHRRHHHRRRARPQRQPRPRPREPGEIRRRLRQLLPRLAREEAKRRPPVQDHAAQRAGTRPQRAARRRRHRTR